MDGHKRGGKSKRKKMERNWCEIEILFSFLILFSHLSLTRSLLSFCHLFYIFYFFPFLKLLQFMCLFICHVNQCSFPFSYQIFNSKICCFFLFYLLHCARLGYCYYVGLFFELIVQSIELDLILLNFYKYDVFLYACPKFPCPKIWDLADHMSMSIT